MSLHPVRKETGRRLQLSAVDLALFGVVLAWGFAYVAYKVGLQEIPTGLFNLVRYIMAVPALWAVLLFTKEDWRLPRQDWVRTVATGVLGVLIYSMVFATAAKLTSAANLSLLLALSPIFTVMIQLARGRTAPGARFIVGSLVALAGAGLVIAFGVTRLEFSLDNLWGDLLGVASSVIFAWYGLVSGPLLKAHSGIKVQAWINLVALVGFLVFQGPAAMAFDWAAVTPAAWWSVVYIALLGTSFSHVVWYTAMAKVGPGHVMLAMYLVPVFAASFGTLVLGQPFGVLQGAGAAIALCGVALVRRRAA